MFKPKCVAKNMSKVLSFYSTASPKLTKVTHLKHRHRNIGSSVLSHVRQREKGEGEEQCVTKKMLGSYILKGLIRVHFSAYNY